MKLSARLIFTMAVTIAAAMVWPAATPAAAHGYKNGTIDVHHPWTRAGTGAARIAIVSMTLRNVSGKDERLISATMRGGAKVILVAASPDVKAATGAVPVGGGGISVPAGQTIELKATSAHIRIEGLPAPLTDYDQIPMTLVFERSGSLEIEVIVEEAPTQ